MDGESRGLCYVTQKSIKLEVLLNKTAICEVLLIYDPFHQVQLKIGYMLGDLKIV